ncbi:hypothetical protein TNCV_4990101 [Trichonephila clavipes]|uniref:Uncharacterized protein n=1 Tax=Trichonephila clavipes TaxID=2585209 RepID=A0A8X6WC89_TRICX|nr:hypothetical protein TNCV_4990101 [Trichonephila clavipes]
MDAAVKFNTTPNHDSGCRTSVAMHNATVQHPLTMASPNSNLTIIMWQAEAGSVIKHNIVPFRPSLHHWRRKRLSFPVKGKRSNRRLEGIPLC